MKTVTLQFRSTRDVLEAEKLIEESRAAYEIVPVPKEISPECGVAIRIAEPVWQIFRETLRRRGIDARPLDE